jgi:hypothetical protein
VRLRDEPLLLQHRHVVADGGTGDPEGVPVDDHLGADGLVRGDVVGHDRPQDGEAALVGIHGGVPPPVELFRPV